MKKDIKKVLSDLYQLDPSLKKHEGQLVKLLTELLANKPNIKFDQKFAKQLKDQLLSQIGQKEVRPFDLKNNFSFMKKFIYALGGAALAVVFIIPSMYYFSNKPGQVAFIPTTGISNVAANAFGALQNQSAQQQEAIGLGGGGGGLAIAPKSTSAIDSRAVSSIAPMPYYIDYQYVYKGEPISIDEQSVAVYKRIKGDAGGLNLAGITNAAGLNLVSLSTFRNLKVDNIAIVEDKDQGYFISVSFPESMVSISQNWQKWQTGINSVYQPLSLSQALSDEELIKIANQFVSDHNISLDHYGSPVVNNQWRQYIDTQNQYVPDVLTVIYPLIVDGHEIYDQSGQPAGISANIDVRTKKVSGVYNITVYNYQSSQYDTQQDADKILEFAKRGGSLYPILYEGAQSDKVEVELGTPKLIYIQMYNYNQEKFISDELYVPALMFPVIKTPAGQAYFRQNVIVPIVKELLQTPEVVPMPIRMMETGQGTAGSAGTVVAPSMPVDQIETK